MNGQTEFITYEYLFRNGRLGNQLWQIASTSGIARAMGAEPRFPVWEYQKYFNVPEAFFVKDMPAKARDLGTDYLQELHYFENIAPEVLDWFKPSDRVRAELEQRHPWFFEETHCTAIHVRRGDYVALPNHFPAPSMDYYKRARDLILESAPHTTFVVFSDDIDWCKRNLSISDYARFVSGTPRPVEVVERLGEPEDQYDLAMISMCDRHIISNSTFSWWGAYLSGDPDTIYPEVWFGPALDNQKCPAVETWVSLPC